MKGECLFLKLNEIATSSILTLGYYMHSLARSLTQIPGIHSSDINNSNFNEWNCLQLKSEFILGVITNNQTWQRNNKLEN